MAEYHPHFIWNRHDYLPAAGHDALLPAYDLLTRVLGMGRVYATLIDHADLQPGQRVLEIGCGTGNLTTRAKRSSPDSDLTGTDPDPRALQRAQRKAKGMAGIRFERAYAQQLPFGDDEFDRALSSMMLHHLDDATKAAAAAELFRVLKPGGLLNIVDVRGDGIPSVFEAAGFDCATMRAERHRVIGQITYYRATRPNRTPPGQPAG